MGEHAIAFLPVIIEFNPLFTSIRHLSVLLRLVRLRSPIATGRDGGRSRGSDMAAAPAAAGDSAPEDPAEELEGMNELRSANGPHASHVVHVLASMALDQARLIYPRPRPV